MKTRYSSILCLLALAGCASPAQTPDALMQLPRDEVFEVTQTASVPASVAYKNILQKARQCWERSGRVIEAESLHPTSRRARMTLTTPPEIAPAIALAVVEVTRASENTTALTGRSLVATTQRTGDLRNLLFWAEGKQVLCSA